MTGLELTTDRAETQPNNDANTQVSATSIVGRARLAKGLPLDFHEYREPIRFSLALARATNVTDATVHYKLQTLTAGQSIVADCAFRGWVVHYSIADLLRELPCFTSRSTVQSSLERMAAAKLIDVSNTGKLLGYETDDKAWAMDKQGCYRVHDTAPPDDLITLEAEDVRTHGFLRACILSTVGDGWTKLSATELAKALPLSRESIQTDIKTMLGTLLEKHPDKPKLHRLIAKAAEDIAFVPVMLARERFR